jgi:hypothetical protein
LTNRIVVSMTAAILLVGCIDSSRVNDVCSWTDTVTRQLDLGRRSDREHLRQDAEIANDLMVRFGDAHIRHNPQIQRPFRDQCIEATVDSIIARHGVTRTDFHAAEQARIWWADFLVVFLPMGILAIAMMDFATRRVCRAFEPEDRTIALVSIVALTPVVALLALGIANFWSFAAEGYRLRNGHVSNRAFLIPVVTHGWIAYTTALTICAGAAAARFHRTPLTGGRRPMFSKPPSRASKVSSSQRTRTGTTVRCFNSGGNGATSSYARDND